MRNTILTCLAKKLPPVFAFVLFVATNATAQSIPVNFYKPKVDFSTGTNPYINILADIDGDGKPDMVTCNSTSNTISVFRNTSTEGAIDANSFATKIDFATGDRPVHVVAGDIDADGKLDIIVTNLNSHNVSIFRNTSSPGSISTSSFANKVDVAAVYEPYSASVGDLDGDGKLDILVANISTTILSLIRNTSTPGVVNAASFNKFDLDIGAAPSFVSINDMDGDGKADLVVATGTSLSVLRNTSTIGILDNSSFASKVDFAAGSYPFSIAVGDIDGDGKPDMAVSNVNSDNVSVFRNTSSPGNINASSFAGNVDFTVGSHPPYVTIGDVDGDSKPDIVSANQLSNTISVLRNISTSGGITSSSFAAKTDFATGAEPLCVVIGDLNGDGLTELSVSNLRSNTVSVFQVNALNVTIPDVKALNYSGIAFNTIYLGFGPASAITLTVQTLGTAPYSYNWSNGATTQSITVSPLANTTYTVTVIDADGSVGTASKEVIVKNVNCSNGKIYMCHITGNSNHFNTICIDNNAVATHLAAGCSLGECIGSRNAPSAIEGEVKDFAIQVLPNPSKNYFTLTIRTSDASPISVRVMDVLGRVVETRTNVSSGNLIFGNKLTAGVYLAEITQGTNRKVIKLVKQ